MPAEDALTADEKVRFADLIQVLDSQFANVEPALMRARLHGRDVAVVVAVHDPDEDGVRVDPLAVLVDDTLLALLVPPDGADIAVA